MRIHIVANLTARGLQPRPNGHEARLALLRGTARGRATLHETRSVEEVERVIAEVLTDGVDLLILAGGDGTFMSGVTALHRKLKNGSAHHQIPFDRRSCSWHAGFPRVGLLPLGTVGTIARNLGEPGDPIGLLDGWLRAPDRVHAIPRPTLRIRAERADGARDERVGFIVGTGLVARFFEVYESGGANGLPQAAKVVSRVFVESFTGGPLAKRILTPIPCELWVDGERAAPRGLSLLCASVVRDLGLGMKVCYRAAEEPDRVHLVASALPPSQLGPRAPWVLLGRTIGGRDHVDRLVRSFEVRFPDLDGPYVLDGDMFRAKTVEVGAGPIIPIVGPRDF